MEPWDLIAILFNHSMNFELCGGYITRQARAQLFFRKKPREIWIFTSVRARDPEALLHYIRKISSPKWSNPYYSSYNSVNFSNRRSKKKILIEILKNWKFLRKFLRIFWGLYKKTASSLVRKFQHKKFISNRRLSGFTKKGDMFFPRAPWECSS